MPSSRQSETGSRLARDSRRRARTRSSSRSQSPRRLPPPPKPWVSKPPQKSIDEFWAKFTTKTPGKPFTILPDNLYAKRLAASRRDHPVDSEIAVRSYDEAVRICKEKVAKIVKECKRVNQKYRDLHFDIEADFNAMRRSPRWFIPDCLMSLDQYESSLIPGSVKRVEDIFLEPSFYVDGPAANDVRQGKDGDCWLMSALCTLSNRAELIERVCVVQDEKVGVYGFVFHRDGEWISEVIDDKLYLIKEDFDESMREKENWLDVANRQDPSQEYKKVMQTGSRALYFGQCEDPNETWLPLLEKAYAKAHGDYNAIEGGFVGEAIEDLTGGVTTEVFSTDILDKDKFWNDEICKVNQEFLFGCGQPSGANGVREGVVEFHAYSIMDAKEIDGKRLVKLRNLWGKFEWKGPWSDGSSEWTPEWMTKLNHTFGDDGVFWMSYSDLLRVYQHFDRTRLFGPEWRITQKWTSLNIPWSVDYQDTKFTVTVSEPGPVVIVLSQLDDRYFKGLEGEYVFKLQFRLHKENETEYIVRSPASYYMKRSVSTEVTLEEAGTYSVLLKITAKRYADRKAVEQVVRENCRGRRDKVLAIGLSYDLAHAKGQFRESEKEKADREKHDRKEKRKAEAKARYEQRRRHLRKQKVHRLRKEAKAEQSRHRVQQEGRDVSTPRADETTNVDERTPIAPSAPANAGPIDQTAEIRDDPNTTAPAGEAAGPAVAISANINTPHSQNGTGDSPAETSLLEHQPSQDPSSSAAAPQVQLNGNRLPIQNLTIDEVSDDEISWDSDIHWPSSTDSDDEDAPPDPIGSSSGYNLPPLPLENDDDEFTRDPWNAVCVVGLRVYSTKGDVSIEVVKPDAALLKAKKLDVDDSAADATKDVSGAAVGAGGDEEVLEVRGSAPEAVESDRQG